VVDPAQPGRLVLRETDLREPYHNEAVIQVHAVSLNRGEVNRALSYADAGWQPGWDFAGVVERAADDGTGPREGERVVGMVSNSAWAERVIAPTHAIASLPEKVSFAQASTLPVAGLTALHALRQGGLLIGRSVLITGATGGVGDYAIQLARLSGAFVVAHIRREEQRSTVTEWGAEAVAVGESLAEAAKSLAPFDLILDSVGGAVLADALGMLKEGGVCVNYGVSAGAEVTFDAAKFFLTGRARLYGLILFDELKSVEPASIGLSLLAKLIAEGKLTPHIHLETDWTEVADVAAQLRDRKFSGKAVLHLR
jgi:NADPH:quinone reductase-like Zn-dependent oxidoreductase